jgi:PII-like signaling protein
MTGSFLRFYVHEGDRHRGKLLWEWLLIQANERGIPGGSAFKASAGFGRHHKLSEDRFLELAGALPVEVEFIVSDEQAEQLLALIRRENISAFYARIPAHFGTIDPESPNPPSFKAGE